MRIEDILVSPEGLSKLLEHLHGNSNQRARFGRDFKKNLPPKFYLRNVRPIDTSFKPSDPEKLREVEVECYLITIESNAFNVSKEDWEKFSMILNECWDPIYSGGEVKDGFTSKYLRDIKGDD